MGSSTTHQNNPPLNDGVEKNRRNEDTIVFYQEALNEPDPIFHGTFEFDIGEVSHPIYGSGHIKGEIPLVLPKGVYVPTCPEKTQKAYEFLVKWADAHGLIYKTKKFRNEQIRLAIAITDCVINGNADSALLMAIATIHLGTFLFEDIFELTNLFSSSGEFGDAEFNFLKGICEDIYGGKYKNFSELPTVDIPMLKPFPVLSFLMYELREMIKLENQTDSSASKQSQLKNDKLSTSTTFGMGTLNAAITLTNSKFIDSCSEQTFLAIRGEDVGSATLAEWILKHKHKQISDEIRSTVVFKRFLQCSSQASALINDIFSLRKELEEKTCGNIIVRKVIRKKISLTAAVQEVLAMLNDELKDMQVCANKLLDDYPECDDLRYAIEIARYGTDGQLFMYGHPDCAIRYGNAGAKYKLTYACDDPTVLAKLKNLSIV